MNSLYSTTNILAHISMHVLKINTDLEETLTKPVQTSAFELGSNMK